jgi:DNA-binding response OmpR family regulator
MSGRARVLIVDDEPNARLMFRTALEPAGYEPAEAGDGLEALRALEAGPPPALVLLDLRMPALDGMEVLRRLRAAGRDVPVVIVTAHGSVPDAVEAMKLGAIDFVQKPVAPEALRAVVAEVIRRAVADDRPAARPAGDDRAPATAAGLFAADLARAKRALNRRWFEEAEAYLKQALGLDPGSAEAHNLLGVLHELRNEHDASYRHYRAALKADKHYEPAQHNMRRYYERFTFGASTVPVDTGDG